MNGEEAERAGRKRLARGAGEASGAGWDAELELRVECKRGYWWAMSAYIIAGSLECRRFFCHIDWVGPGGQIGTGELYDCSFCFLLLLNIDHGSG